MRLLGNRLFVTSLLSDLLSNFGDVMYSLALLNYVLSIPQTKLALAIVSFSEIFPIITMLLTGYLSDKTPSKVKGILWSQVVRTFIYIGVGLVMRFSPHLWIVVVVSLFNILSDFTGQYESGLFLPLSLKMVSQEEQEQAIAFRQGVTYSFNVCYQPLSAILVGLCSYSTLAYVNAGTFFLAFLMMLSIRTPLKALPLEMPSQSQVQSKLSLWQEFKLAVNHLRQIPELRLSLQVVPLINGLFTVISMLVVLSIATYPAFSPYPSAQTIALVNMAYILGMIAGSFLVMRYLANLTMESLLKFGTLILTLVFVGLQFQLFYLLVFALFIGGVLIGAGNPKFNAMLYRMVPSDKLATISGGVMTYFLPFVKRISVLKRKYWSSLSNCRLLSSFSVLSSDKSVRKKHTLSGFFKNKVLQ